MIFCLTEKKTNSMRGWFNQDHTASWKQKQLCYPKEWMKTYAEIWEITLTKRYSFDWKALTTFTFNRKAWEERGDVLWGIGPPRGQTASGIGDPTGCSSLCVGQAESHLPSNKKKSWKTANAHLSMVLCTCVRGFPVVSWSRAACEWQHPWLRVTMPELGLRWSGTHPYLYTMQPFPDIKLILYVQACFSN